MLKLYRLHIFSLGALLLNTRYVTQAMCRR